MPGDLSEGERQLRRRRGSVASRGGLGSGVRGPATVKGALLSLLACLVSNGRVLGALGGGVFALGWRPRRWQAQLSGTIVETSFQLVQLGLAIVGSLLALVRRRISHVGVRIAVGGNVVSPVRDEVAPLGRPRQLIAPFVVTHPAPSSPAQADVYDND
jgi:hypothetical protein